MESAAKLLYQLEAKKQNLFTFAGVQSALELDIVREVVTKKHPRSVGESFLGLIHKHFKPASVRKRYKTIFKNVRNSSLKSSEISNHDLGTLDEDASVYAKKFVTKTV